MSTKKQKFIIIDGNSLLHRAWHALPPLTTQKGEVVNAVYGFAMVFLKILQEMKPDYLAVAWDRREPTFRHKVFKEYKAQREKQPNELYWQIDRIKQLMTLFNIPNYEKAGYEADDVIATLVKLTPEKEIQDIILTGDLDTLQLVDPVTEVCTLRKGITDTVVYDEKAVWERYGLIPKELIDFKALRGDPSDNIPGVKGIGEKTALDLMKKFHSLEELYKAIEEDSQAAKDIRERVKKILKEQKEQAFFSRKLVILFKDVPLKFSLENCQLKGWDREKIFQLFKELEFKSLLSRVPNFWKENKEQAEEEKSKVKKEGADYQLIDEEKKFEHFFTALKKQKYFSLDTETTDLDTFKARLLGISFSWQQGQAYYVVYKKEWIEKLKPILADEKIKKCGHNLKYDLKVLNNHQIDFKGLDFDSMIAAYLLNPGNRTYGLDDVVFQNLGYQMQPIEELIGPKGKGQLTMNLVKPEKVSWYSCEDADYSLRLKQALQPMLEENKLFELFREIEMPLIPVLAQMEILGVKVDAGFLNEMNMEVSRLLKSLTEKIYKLAGEEFNIDSPLQLRQILFEKLKISFAGIKKSKTGLSTAAPELMKLKDRHPIIAYIFEYRELAKLKSTYLEALPKLINTKTGRIHTNFNQTITATGRLSSSDPNLQNIPTRTDLGNKIRHAFVADKGYKILSGDYSQIELRIIASLANDESMIKSFKQGEDIHIRTAAAICGCPLSEVTPEMRYAAKSVNFGIIYGMSPHGLSEGTGLSFAQAKQFMEKYFTLHPLIADFIQEKKQEAHDLGYVQTFFGRRRYLPEIYSDMPQLRNEAERMAINMPIQGTAADLIKIAMIQMQAMINEFNQEHPDSCRMILQVHDELVFEIKEKFIAELAPKIRKIMEAVIKLKVPVKVDISLGDNWGEMEKL